MRCVEGLFTGLFLFGTAANGADFRDDWRWITSQDLRAKVSYLASDSLGGRGVGEPGIRVAEEFIAAAFAEAGLVPLPGRDDYFLPFSLYTRGFDSDSTALRISSGSLSMHGDAGATVRPFDFSDEGEVETTLEFAGYGITAPELGYDDYADLDVSGKVVLVLRHEPRERDPESPFEGDVHSQHAFFARKAENALRHGARGILVVTDPLHHEDGTDLRMSDPLYLDRDEAAFATEVIPSELPPDRSDPFLAMQIDGTLVDSLFQRIGFELRAVQAQIDESLRPVRVDLGDPTVRMQVDREDTVRVVEARNIAGLLPGSDPERADEWIVVGAHHDHLGTFRGSGDTVFNGADDNASGTAAVLALARAFGGSSHRSPRSIVFTTFSAEERGLLGSYAMVGQNQIDVDRVEFLLNIDMIGRNPDRPVDLTGDGFSRGLEDIIRSANAGLEVPLQLGGTSMIGNTDHVAFAERDIPFLTFFTGTHPDYHELGDHPELLDYERMERIVRLAHGVVSGVAERRLPLPFLTDLPWLGVTIETEPSDTGRTLATIREVEDESPAERAALQQGDVITAIGEEPIGDPPRIGERFAKIPPGSTTTVGVRRLAPIAAHDSSSTSHDLVMEIERARPGYLGIAPGKVTDDLRRSLGLQEGEGVLVRQVMEAGPANAAGLQAGDVILSIAGRPVAPNNLRGRLAQIGAKEKVALELMRAGERRSLMITLGSLRPS